MEEELKELKTTLQCLVVSSPVEVNVVSLIRDFKRLTGHPIPYQRYGFRNATSFLRTKFGDSFLFSGAPKNPTITAMPETQPESHKSNRRSVPEAAAQAPQHSSHSGSDKKKSDEQQSTNQEEPQAASMSSNTPATSEPEDIITKILQFEDLERDILNILVSHPDGMWFSDLMREYEDRHDRTLSSHFEFFYSKNIEELMLVMFDTVSLRRPDEQSEWLVFDSSKPMPTRSARPQPHGAASAVDSDDALPFVEYDPDVFPEDCVQMDMKSEQPGPFANIEYAISLEVVIGEIYSPTQFWLVRDGQQYSAALETMQEQMKQYYEHGEGKSRVLSLPATRMGQYCAIQYRGKWHRARVLRVSGLDLNAEVLLIDYGGTVQSPRRELKPLCLRWGDLPRQAMQARLADLAPAYGNMWPEAACSHMAKLVRNKRLNARVVGIEVETNVLLVQLIIKEESKRVDVCHELQRLGYARHERDGDADLDSGEDQAWGWQMPPSVS